MIMYKEKVEYTLIVIQDLGGFRLYPNGDMAKEEGGNLLYVSPKMKERVMKEVSDDN